VAEERRPSRRARQAEQTGRDIVAAARRLFAQQGYTATSMAQIAAEADVSVQTIYDSVGSKSAIVRRLNDLLDDEGDVAALASQIATTTDPVELLRIAVAISRNINERCHDIVAAIYSAASAEPEMSAVRDESRRRHREGIGRLAGRLASLGALRADIDVETAADVIAGLTDPQIAQTFVAEYNWTWERWHTWTVRALATLVLSRELEP
jgi:AcrR family transcriptional regulator